ncbi:MAG: hypothetical protein COX79_04075 [Candidatus Levybacteria bacterium CG_4_10_14_0_2_um_filter_36_16]|nr:MAG: hypothetical protein AUK12_04775 [Candidatus Levybacteria bacterium CG2_30_37_29]PIR79007.1 MAG: hypothetical protein COU26_03480 [Candidatus Levybacteria bacterium CG10_big_fil_rev_8_21_14_0_10_36_30]PIZ96890.1 MAG: hypothetical protein COX79_04075 [Candidatus Levybacteria bacterium CG_4_10_14_0_2_um_filter_36_16]
MKIGFFTDGFLPQPNGVATSVFSTARELEKKGHEVFVVAPKYPGYKDELNVFRLTSIKVMKRPEFRLALHLPDKPFRKLLRLDFDIIHAHSPGPVALLGWEIAKAKDVPFISTYHTLWNKYTHYVLKGKVIRPKMVEQATRLFGNRCDYLIAPTEKVKNELVRYGIKRPVEIVPTGVDVQKFGVSKKGYFYEKFKTSKNERIALCVVRLGKEKSVDFVLRAFKKILKKSPNTTLFLVGEGVEKKNLLKLAKKIGIGNKTIFTGFIEHDILPRAYADADVFLFASQTETQGMVILEAFASGLPVVAVDDDALRGVVLDGENGFLVAKDEELFAQKALDVLENPMLRKKLSLCAKQTAKEHSVFHTTGILEALYKDVLTERSRKSIQKLMNTNTAREQLYVVLLSFWVTIFIVRIATFLLYAPKGPYPLIGLFNNFFTHATIGFVLVALSLVTSFKKKELPLFALLLFGVGIALIFDELWVLATGGAATIVDYWARGNMLVIVLAGALPALFVKYIKKNRPQFFFGHQSLEHRNPQAPKISVVVPAYNEEEFIVRTIKSLVNQTRKDFELIVVDNASTDNTGLVAAQYGARVIREEKKGVANARQTGFMAAKGEIILTTDADTVVPQDWIEKIIPHFKDENVAAFGGINRLYSGPVTARAGSRYLSTLFWVVDKFLSGGWNLLGSNLSVRKSSFLAIGGFNTALTLGEDVDLSQRIKKVGKVILDPNFLVFSSGRRFRSGLIVGVLTYAPSWFARVVFKKDKFLTFPTIRDEHSLIGRFTFVPLLFCVVFLATLFYVSNPSVFRAREIRFLQKSAATLQEFFDKTQSK